MFEGIELSTLDLDPSPFQSPDRCHVQTSDDGHQGVEVGHVDAISRHFNPELNDFNSTFFLGILTNSGGDEERQTVEPSDVRVQVDRLVGCPGPGLGCVFVCGVRTSLRLGKGVDQLLGAEKTKVFQLQSRQLLSNYQRIEGCHVYAVVTLARLLQAFFILFHRIQVGLKRVHQAVGLAIGCQFDQLFGGYHGGLFPEIHGKPNHPSLQNFDQVFDEGLVRRGAHHVEQLVGSAPHFVQQAGRSYKQSSTERNFK